MKNSFLIIIILLGITSSHTHFLRELDVTVTLKSVNFKSSCVTSLPESSTYEIVLTVPGSSSIVEATTTKLGLNEKGNATATLATSCTIPQKTTTTAAEDVTVSCKTTDAGTDGKTYVLTTPDADVIEGDITISKWTAKTEEIGVNANFVDIASEQTKEQSFDYKEEGDKAFTIVFANDLADTQKPKGVKAGDKTITGCTIDSSNKTIYSCPITNTTLPIEDNKETSYKISITNACEQEVDTGITVKVKNGSSSSSSFFNQISLLALTVFGVLLF